MKYEPNADPTLANIRESISMDFEMEKDSIIFVGDKSVFSEFEFCEE